MDYYMHILPGRIRIRASKFRKSEVETFSIGTFLKTLDGVTSVKINSVVGSLLIDYDRRAISYQWILNQLAKQGFAPDIILGGRKMI